ncbi:MAG: hypothetical protein H6726_04615 [Sandaracinaceae bacterium]|nr:hypothetical protein [Myxococcales bacterium]MCB9656913.1 hypothetical protein [Sandaracinaceae bacterium]
MHWLVLLLGPGCGARMPAATPSGATAAAELEDFAAFVEAVHPDPLRFVTRDDFAQVVAREAERLRSYPEPTELQVGVAFQRVAASLHDSHVAVAQPAYQLDREVSFVPLLIDSVEGELLVDASSLNDGELPLGTALEAIDGHDAAAIRAAIGPLVIFEGTNDAARERVLSADFVPLFHLAFGMRPSYTLRLRLPDGGVMELVDVPGVGRDALTALGAQRRSHVMRGRAADGAVLPSVVVLDDGTRVVRLPSFGVADTAAFDARLDEVIAQLMDAERVVLDVRGNEGGFRTYGVALLNHLVDAPYTQWQRTAVRVRRIPQPFRERVMPLFGASLDLLRAYPAEAVDELHVREGDPLAALMAPASPRLPASLAVFVDGHTNSAANELLLALRATRPDAVVVGEEAGGECERHVGELPVAYVTPAFGVAVAMSLIRIEHVAVPGCALGHGVRPDVPVSYTRADFIAGQDPYVAALDVVW